METIPFLLPMQRIIRGVQVQDQLLRRLRVRFQEHLQQQLSCDITRYYCRGLSFRLGNCTVQRE